MDIYNTKIFQNAPVMLLDMKIFPTFGTYIFEDWELVAKCELQKKSVFKKVVKYFCNP